MVIKLKNAKMQSVNQLKRRFIQHKVCREACYEYTY